MELRQAKRDAALVARIRKRRRASLAAALHNFRITAARQRARIAFGNRGGMGLVMRSVLEERVLVATVVQLARVGGVFGCSSGRWVGPLS